MAAPCLDLHQLNPLLPLLLAARHCVPPTQPKMFHIASRYNKVATRRLGSSENEERLGSSERFGLVSGSSENESSTHQPAIVDLAIPAAVRLRR